MPFSRYAAFFSLTSFFRFFISALPWAMYKPAGRGTYYLVEVYLPFSFCFFCYVFFFSPLPVNLLVPFFLFYFRFRCCFISMRCSLCGAEVCGACSREAFFFCYRNSPCRLLSYLAILPNLIFSCRVIYYLAILLNMIFSCRMLYCLAEICCSLLLLRAFGFVLPFLVVFVPFPLLCILLCFWYFFHVALLVQCTKSAASSVVELLFSYRILSSLLLLLLLRVFYGVLPSLFFCFVPSRLYVFFLHLFVTRFFTLFLFVWRFIVLCRNRR